MYAYNNSLSLIDPWGLFTLGDAGNSLVKKGIAPKGPSGGYSNSQLFEEWLVLERANTEWRDELRSCPKKINVKDGKPCNPDSKKWNAPGRANPEHKGATYAMRSKPTDGGHASQCTYDEKGNLITFDEKGNPIIPAAGTADFVSKNKSILGHLAHDWEPWKVAKQLGLERDYYEVRPIK